VKKRKKVKKSEGKLIKQLLTGEKFGQKEPVRRKCWRIGRREGGYRFQTDILTPASIQRHIVISSGGQVTFKK
jgi:hypothetical protein